MGCVCPDTGAGKYSLDCTVIPHAKRAYDAAARVQQCGCCACGATYPTMPFRCVCPRCNGKVKAIAHGCTPSSDRSD